MKMHILEVVERKIFFFFNECGSVKQGSEYSACGRDGKFPFITENLLKESLPLKMAACSHLNNTHGDLP